MQENVSVIIATILTVVIIVLFPIYNVATRTDSMANTIVLEATTSFVDEVRYKGYIDENLYNKFIDNLNKTGNRYEVEMEVYKPILIETSGEEQEENQEFEQKYEIIYTADILEELYTDVASANSTVAGNVYGLDVDYKFYVRVRNTNMTQAQVLLERLVGGESKDRIVVNYGGIVYNNDVEAAERRQTSNTNMFLSRPMHKVGNDFEEAKFEYITTVYDEVTGKGNDMYGIAVRISDEGDNEGYSSIKFKLKYKEIRALINEDREDISMQNNPAAEEARENHIKNCVITEGFHAKGVAGGNDIEVEEDSRIEENGLYTLEYTITIKKVVYDYLNNPFLHGKVKIKAGSGYSDSGELGQLSSEEFIIFYEIHTPYIEYIKVQGDKKLGEFSYSNKFNLANYGSKVNFEVKADIDTEAPIKIHSVTVTINGVEYKDVLTNADGIAIIQVDFDKIFENTTFDRNGGTQIEILAYATDERNVTGETSTYNLRVYSFPIITEVQVIGLSLSGSEEKVIYNVKAESKEAKIKEITTGLNNSHQPFYNADEVIVLQTPDYSVAHEIKSDSNDSVNYQDTVFFKVKDEKGGINTKSIYVGDDSYLSWYLNIRQESSYDTLYGGNEYWHYLKPRINLYSDKFYLSSISLYINVYLTGGSIDIKGKKRNNEVSTSIYTQAVDKKGIQNLTISNSNKNYVSFEFYLNGTSFQAWEKRLDVKITGLEFKPKQKIYLLGGD